MYFKMNTFVVTKHFVNAKLKSDKPGEKNFAADCKHCVGRKISGNVSSSANFIKHLRDVHPSVHAQFVADRSGLTKGPVKRPRDEDDAEASSSKKQCTLEYGIQKQTAVARGSVISQKQFEHHLLVMLLEDMQPIATVERSGFQKFCSNILPHIRMPSRRTIGRQVEELYQQQKTELIDELKNVQYVSVAADLWSSHKRGFLGLTVHYINKANLQRVSHVLACRRFKHAQ